MADKIFTKAGTNRGPVDVDQGMHHDNGDGSFDSAVGAHQYVWNGISWVKSTGAGGGAALSGWTPFNATSGDGSTALTNSAQQIKGTAGTLGGWYIYNPNASAAYVPIYNVASASVTVGTTNPAMILTIPPGSAANLELTNGIKFDTAISVAAASTAGGNGAPAAALEANFFYS